MLNKQNFPQSLTSVFAEVNCVLLVRDDLFQVDDGWVVQLTENLDLSDGGDRESLLLILETNFLQRN